MTNEPVDKGKKHPLRKMAIVVVAGFLSLVALIIALAVALPYLVSSNWAKNMVETQASQTLNRPVAIDRLFWSWTHGLTIQGLRVGDLPEFSSSPLMELGRFHLNIGFRFTGEKQIQTRIDTDQITIRLIRTHQGKINLLELLANLPKSAMEPQPSESVPKSTGVRVPMDIQTMVHMGRIHILMEDRMENKTLALTRGDMRLAIPSLLTRPITLGMTGDLTLNNAPQTPPAIDVTVTNLFTGNGVLNIEGIQINLAATLPGIQCAVAGDGKDRGIQGEVQLNLNEIFHLARPFLPPEQIPEAVSGQMAISVDVKANQYPVMAFRLGVSGNDFSLSGGPLKDSGIGPIGFQTEHQGTMDLAGGTLTISQGKMESPGLTQVQWYGKVSGIIGTNPEIAIHFGPVQVYPARWYEMVRPLLPPEVAASVNFGNGDCVLAIHGIDVQGTVSDGNLTVDMRELDLNIPELAYRHSDVQAHLSGIHVGLDAVNTKVTSLFPDKLTMACEVRMDTVHLKGHREIRVEGLAVNPITVQVDHMKKVEGALGMSGQVALAQSLSVDQIQVDGMATVHQMHQSAQLGLEVAADETVHLTIPRVALEIPDIRITHPAIQAQVRQLRIPDLSIEATPIRLVDTSPFFISGNILIRQALAMDGLDAPGFGGLDRLDQSMTLACDLTDAGQARVSLAPFHMAITGIRITHPQAKGQMDRLEISDMKLKASDIGLSDTSLLGLTGTISIEETLGIGNLNIKKWITAPRISQSSQIQCRLDQGSRAVIRVPSVALAIPEFEARVPDLGIVQTQLDLTTAISEAVVNRMSPVNGDVQGIQLDMALGNLATLHLNADARDLATSEANCKGNLALNLGAFPRNLLKQILKGGRLDGNLNLEWDLAGRRPNPQELNRLMAMTGIDLKNDINFIHRMTVSAAVDRVGLAYPMADNQWLRVQSVSTSSPLTYSLSGKNGKGQFSGNLTLNQIEEIPGKGKLPKPLTVRLAFSGDHDHESIRLTQSLRAEPLNLKQTLNLSLAGLNKISQSALNRPPATWIHLLGGAMDVLVALDKQTDLSLIMDGLNITGGLDCRIRTQWIPGRKITSSLQARMPSTDIHLDKTIRMKGVQAELDMTKTFSLVSTASDGVPTSNTGKRPRPLSVAVMESAGPEPSVMAGSAASEFIARMQGRYRSRHTLSFSTIETLGTVAPIPVQLKNGALDVDLENGLPRLDFFQMDLFGGTIMGELRILKNQTGFGLQTRIAFSGIDTRKMAAVQPRSVSGTDSDTELSGQVAATIPLTPDLDTLLRDLNLDVKFTHIGRRALARALYALDPYESDETITKQRKLLRTGTPRWIRIKINGGNLSLKGEVEAAGIPIQIPQIRRLNLAGVSGLDAYAGSLKPLNPIIEILKMISADMLRVDKTGKIQFVSR